MNDSRDHGRSLNRIHGCVKKYAGVADPRHCGGDCRFRCGKVNLCRKFLFSYAFQM